MKQARAPTAKIPNRMTHKICFSLALLQKSGCATLCANIEAAENIDESADDITAAEIAPRPTNETAGGQRYCRTRGSTNFLFSGIMILSTVLL